MLRDSTTGIQRVDTCKARIRKGEIPKIFDVDGSDKTENCLQGSSL
jgi:hypothetical protein